MPLVYRKAKIDDILQLKQLIADSARALAVSDYTKEQIEAAIGTVWGVDEELIHDQTYFVVEDGNSRFAACGGWSKRKKLFGASGSNESSPLLNPNVDSARIRAFFVHPDFTRRGIGREIIRLCEQEASLLGFKRMELMATLPGHRLYKACGYLGDKVEDCGTTVANTHACVPMYKTLSE